MKKIIKMHLAYCPKKILSTISIFLCLLSCQKTPPQKAEFQLDIQAFPSIFNHIPEMPLIYAFDESKESIQHRNQITQKEQSQHYLFSSLRLKGDYVFPLKQGFIPILDLDFESPEQINQTLVYRADILSILPSLILPLPQTQKEIKQALLLWAQLLSFNPFTHVYPEPSLNEISFDQKLEALYQSPLQIKELVHRYQLFSLYFQTHQADIQSAMPNQQKAILNTLYQQLIQAVRLKTKQNQQHDQQQIQLESGEWLWLEHWLTCPELELPQGFESNLDTKPQSAFQVPYERQSEQGFFKLLGVCEEGLSPTPLILTPKLDQNEPLEKEFTITGMILDPLSKLQSITFSYQIFNRDWQVLSTPSLQLEKRKGWFEYQIRLNAEALEGQKIKLKIDASTSDQNRYQRSFSYQTKAQAYQPKRLLAMPLLSNQPIQGGLQEVLELAHQAQEEILCQGVEELFCQIDPTQALVTRLAHHSHASDDSNMSGLPKIATYFNIKTQQWESITQAYYALITQADQEQSVTVITKFTHLAYQLFANHLTQYQAFLNDFSMFFDLTPLSTWFEEGQNTEALKQKLFQSDKNQFWQACFAWQKPSDERSQFKEMGHLALSWTQALYLGCLQSIDFIKQHKSQEEQDKAISLFKKEIPILFESQTSAWLPIKASEKICGLAQDQVDDHCLLSEISFKNAENSPLKTKWEPDQSRLWTQQSTTVELTITDRMFKQDPVVELILTPTRQGQARQSISCQKLQQSNDLEQTQDEPSKTTIFQCPLVFEEQAFRSLQSFILSLSVKDGLERQREQSIFVQLLPIDENAIDHHQLLNSPDCRLNPDFPHLHYECLSQQTALSFDVLFQGFTALSIDQGQIEGHNDQHGFINRLEFQQLSEQAVNAYHFSLLNPFFELTLTLEIHVDHQSPILKLKDLLYLDERAFNTQREINLISPTLYSGQQSNQAVAIDEAWVFYKWFHWIKPSIPLCDPTNRAANCIHLNSCQDDRDSRCLALHNKINLVFEVEDQAQNEKLLLSIYINERVLQYDIYAGLPISIDIDELILESDKNGLNSIEKTLEMLVTDPAGNTSHPLLQKIIIHPILPPIDITFSNAPFPKLNHILDQPSLLEQRVNLSSLQVMNPHPIPLTFKISPFDSTLFLMFGLLELGIDINLNTVTHVCLKAQDEILSHHFLKGPVFQNMSFSGGMCQIKTPWERSLDFSQSIMAEYLDPPNAYPLSLQNQSLIHTLMPFANQQYTLYLPAWDLPQDITDMLNQSNDRLQRRYFKDLENGNGLFFSENREINTFVYGFRLWFLDQILFSFDEPLVFQVLIDDNAIEGRAIQSQNPIPDFNQVFSLP